LLLNHRVKKGKLHLHDNCDSGPGPGTYSSTGTAFMLRNVHTLNWRHSMHLKGWGLNWVWRCWPILLEFAEQLLFLQNCCIRRKVK